MNNSMNIMVSVNSNYVKYLIVLLVSIFENNKNSAIKIYLLYCDVEDRDLHILRDLCEQYNNQLIALKIEKEIFNNYPVTYIWTIETYFRLLCIDILPEDMDRILYLDVDIAVDGSLKELYGTDFEDHYMIVCEDNNGYISNIEKNKEWNRSEEIKYFNAGVLLLNLQKLKQDYSFEKIESYARKLDYKLEFVDQDLLNYIFGESVKYVDYAVYNKMVLRCEEGLDKYKGLKTVIYHYAADNKPWGSAFLTPFFSVWWEYAKLSPSHNEICSTYFNICNSKVNEETGQFNIYKHYYSLCVKWLKDKKDNKILDFFKYYKYETIAIYGMGELGILLLDQLRKMNVDVRFGCDKNANMIYYDKINLKIYSPEECWPEADAIVVTPITYFDAIKADLDKKHNLNIVSLKEVIEFQIVKENCK